MPQNHETSGPDVSGDEQLMDWGEQHKQGRYSDQWDCVKVL